MHLFTIIITIIMVARSPHIYMQRACREQISFFVNFDLFFVMILFMYV